jgi:hypothetical protein
MESTEERTDSQSWRQALLVMMIASLLRAPVSWVDDGLNPEAAAE